MWSAAGMHDGPALRLGGCSRDSIWGISIVLRSVLIRARMDPVMTDLHELHADMLFHMAPREDSVRTILHTCVVRAPWT